MSPPRFLTVGALACALATAVPALAAAARPPRLDPDRDGLTNRVEHRLRLHPRRADTDGDGLRDGYEVRVSRTDARRRDTDRDGASDGLEVRRGTDPRRRPAVDPVDVLPRVWVDGESRSGKCSDAHTPTQARSPATPWCTVDRAIASAPSGTVAHVRGGTYRLGSLTLNGVRRTARTYIRPELTERSQVVLRGELSIANFSNLTIREFQFASGAIVLNVGNRDLALENNVLRVSTYIRPCVDCVFSGNVVESVAHVAGRSDDGFGLYVNGAWSPEPARAGVYRLRVTGNTFRALRNDAIQISGEVFDALVSGNTFENVGQVAGDAAHADCIQAYNVRGIVIEDNRFLSCDSGVLTKDATTTGQVVRNNLFVGGPGTGYGITLYNTEALVTNNTMVGRYNGGASNGVHLGQQAGYAPTRVTLLNNILTTIARQQPGLTVVEDHNLVTLTASGQGAHDLNRAVPVFGTGYVLAPGSPGLNAGTAGSHLAAADMRGRPRVAGARVDIGAVERQPAD